jgi:hypothetical protein
VNAVRRTVFGKAIAKQPSGLNIKKGICMDTLLGTYKKLIRICSHARVHHVTGHNTPIHNILSTAPQLSISPKALGMLPDDGNVIPKHVGDTIHN